MIAIGGGVGGYIPVLLGSGLLSGWSIIGSAIGSIAGLYIAVKISDF